MHDAGACIWCNIVQLGASSRSWSTVTFWFYAFSIQICVLVGRHFVMSRSDMILRCYPWICYKPPSKRQTHFLPWRHFSDSKENMPFQFPKSTEHPNDQGLTFRRGRRVVLGRGQGSLAAATAAGGRPPSPATAYRPRQTCPKNLPWQRRTTHLIEIKYCEDTGPEQQLQAAHAQHGHLRRSIAGGHVLHVILSGVGGVNYIPHT